MSNRREFLQQITISTAGAASIGKEVYEALTSSIAEVSLHIKEDATLKLWRRYFGSHCFKHEEKALSKVKDFHPEIEVKQVQMINLNAWEIVIPDDPNAMQYNRALIYDSKPKNEIHPTSGDPINARFILVPTIPDVEPLNRMNLMVRIMNIGLPPYEECYCIPSKWLKMNARRHLDMNDRASEADEWA